VVKMQSRTTMMTWGHRPSIVYLKLTQSASHEVRGKQSLGEGDLPEHSSSMLPLDNLPTVAHR
jgi:hypothetical protein